MPIITEFEAGRQLPEAFQERKPVRANPLGEQAPAGFRTHERCAWLRGPIEEALIRRQSVRVFAPSAITCSQVMGAIAAARDAGEVVWPSGQHGGVSLEMLIAANNIDGLAPGLYTADEAGVEPLAQEPAYLDILREQYADAPALILICADLNRACREAGQGGYPATLTRAGTAGYAAWLWAVSVGLAGCVYGGASQQASAAGRRLDADLRHLFTVSMGLPAGES